MVKHKHETYKKALELEMEKVVQELQSVGRINPDNPNDWEAVATDLNDPNRHSADLNEEADDSAAYADNIAILENLEVRFNEIKDALQRIEDGTYGICEVSGKEIEPERLNANPAARTSKEHLNEA